MPTPRRGRGIVAIAVSAAAHLVVLIALALHSPLLKAPPEPGGPPIPIIPVVLEPRAPPAGPAAKPQPIRLHRRAQHFIAPVPPLPAPTENPPATSPGPGIVALHPAPLPESPKSELRQALRQGPIGCTNPDAVGLSKAERQVCDQTLGKGAKTAPFTGLGLARAKQLDFDREAARKDADRRYREQQIAPGPAPPGGNSGQPWQIPGDPRR